MHGRNFAVYCGGRSELDRRFREILDALGPGEKAGEFIKRVVVEAQRGDRPQVYGPHPSAEIAKLQNEINEIRKAIQAGIAPVDPDRPVEEKPAPPRASQEQIEQKAGEVETALAKLGNAF